MHHHAYGVDGCVSHLLVARHGRVRHYLARLRRLLTILQAVVK